MKALYKDSKVLHEPDVRYAYRFCKYGQRTRNAFTELEKESQEQFVASVIIKDSVPVLIGGELVGEMRKEKIRGVWNRFKCMLARIWDKR